jgi:hypothetical protein
MIGQWEKRFTPSTPFLMTPSSGESVGWAALPIIARVPSEPLIDVCLARLPQGETNPLSARSRASETKCVAKIGVGLLPFSSTASVWPSSQSHLIWEIQSHLIWNLTSAECMRRHMAVHDEQRSRY